MIRLSAEPVANQCCRKGYLLTTPLETPTLLPHTHGAHPLETMGFLPRSSSRRAQPGRSMEGYQGYLKRQRNLIWLPCVANALHLTPYASDYGSILLVERRCHFILTRPYSIKQKHGCFQLQHSVPVAWLFLPQRLFLCLRSNFRCSE